MLNPFTKIFGSSNDRVIKKMMRYVNDANSLEKDLSKKPDSYFLEFKSELQLSYATSNKSSFGVSYNHVSNASLGDKNPGANSYMFNFIKNF